MLSLLTIDNLLAAYLIIGPYLAFVFFGESLRPFAKPHALMQRPTWRYGRWMALAVFLGNLVAVALMITSDLPFKASIAWGVVVSFGLGFVFSAKRLTSLYLSSKQ